MKSFIYVTNKFIYFIMLCNDIVFLHAILKINRTPFFIQNSFSL